MAICNWCDKDMLEVDTCNVKLVDFGNGDPLPPIPYDGEKCHDCGVTNGKIHHPGCDMERCPRCDGQLISCGCVSGAEGCECD